MVLEQVWQSVEVSFSRTLVHELAQRAGFIRGDIASVPETESAQSTQERERFEAWVQSGCAGEMDYLKRTDEQGELLRTSVRAAFPWARTVIVCLANYNSAQPRSTDAAPADAAWIARYAWSGSLDQNGQGTEPRPSDYHKVLLKRLKALEVELHSHCGEFESRCYVDTGPLVERVYARYAGLGWTGKNTCLINQQLGSWLFLAVIITSLDFPRGELSIPAADRCGSCTRCIDACPTQALTPYRMNASRCISYLTIEKRGVLPHGEASEDLRKGIGRNVFGCDICQDVCPWNRRAPIAIDNEMTPRTMLVNPALDWLAAMDATDFGSWFYGSPVKRARWEGFRRNLAIAMGNSGLDRFIPTLEEWKNTGDEGLADAASWALDELVRSNADRLAE
jgi:epoxyqueuosine reductase